MKLTVIIYPRDDVEREAAADFAHQMVGNWTETDTEVKFTLETEDQHLLYELIAQAERFNARTINYSSK